MSGPLLSITVPTHERVELLSRSLASIVPTESSTVEQIELVVSDNSTTSVVEEHVARFAGSWPSPLRYHRNPPGTGAVRNFNLCVDRATGLYNLMLHDDDYLLPGAIDEIVRILGAADHDRDRVLLFGVQDVTVNEHVIRERRSTTDEFHLPASAMRRLLANSAFVRVPGLVVQSDTYREVGGFRVNAHTTCDFDMSVRLFSRYGVRFVPFVAAAYTVHAGGVTSTVFTPRTIALDLEIFEEVRRAAVLDPDEVDLLQRRWFHQFILAGAWRALRRGDRATAHDVIRLFALPEVRRMGISMRWLPVRTAFTVATIGSGRRSVANGPVDGGAGVGVNSAARGGDVDRDW